ncbi:GNAT family N-acetyltransferase [Actinomadura scrupuli]|uniref:GNAT family N-acetyltransferase n=1 Tax=Actinomadura scrupuli TaxID=559629 RepID=UPI003D97A680
MSITRDSAGSATEAAHAFFTAVEGLVTLMPGGRSRTGRHSTRLLATGLPVATLNGVFAGGTEPDADEVAEFARSMTGGDLPWCIQVRGEPGPAVAGIAAGHGLVRRHVLPLMVRTAARPVPAPGPYPVHRVGDGDRQVYAETLAAGFEAPVDVMAAFASPAILEAPWAAAYLVRNEGEPVATGFGARAGEHIGVFNIATPPRHRRRGYGRAVTEAILRDGFAAGARSAFLQASDEGYSLYESLGFRTVETWTYFVPEGH